MDKKYKIELDSLQEPFEIEGQKLIIAPEEKAAAMLAENSAYREDIKELKEVIYNILDLLGILDKTTGTIKESIKTGEEGYFKHIAKALTGTALLLGKAQISKAAAAELEQSFAFIKNFIPIAEKYANR